MEHNKDIIPSKPAMVNSPNIQRILYFDIDGVFLDYDEQQREILKDGKMEKLLKSLEFDKLICVSGWSDVVQELALEIPVSKQKIAIHALVDEIFPDQVWFSEHLELTSNTDDRCKHINLNEDWYYIDDWADEFFTKQYGKAQYENFLYKRILLVDPYGDGSDILQFLESIRLNSS